MYSKQPGEGHSAFCIAIDFFKLGCTKWLLNCTKFTGKRAKEDWAEENWGFGHEKKNY